MELQPAERTRSGVVAAALVGAAAGVVVIAVWWLLYSVGLAPFPPFDLGDYLIRQSPGDFATWAIETLGDYAQPAALLAGLLAWVAAWAMLGLVVWLRHGSLVGRFAPLILLPAALALGWWSLSGLDLVWIVWLTLAFGATLVGGGFLMGYWLERLADAQREATSPAESWLDHPGDYQRRALLRHIALVTVAVGGGGALVGRLVQGGGMATVTSAGIPLDQARSAIVSPVAMPTPVPAGPIVDDFNAPAGVRPLVTSNAEFYVIDISTRDPSVNEDGWALRVHGLVERELLISWPDLLSMPSVELDGTLMCISYEYTNGLISTTRWTGVPLATVLDRAGIREGVVDLICRGLGGYSDSIPLAEARQETTLLAYGMNGETLPRSHGFPCRLYAPGLYGEKSVKWLQEIELVDYDYQGFWQERGWTDEAVVNTVSIIDTPGGEVSAQGGTVPIGGIAYAGDRGISAVHVQIDDGAWQDATLEPNIPPLIWQRWRFDWRPVPGSYRITVRAVDGAGAVQVATEQPPHPNGITGLHSVTVDVV